MMALWAIDGCAWDGDTWHGSSGAGRSRADERASEGHRMALAAHVATRQASGGGGHARPLSEIGRCAGTQGTCDNHREVAG
uniref:Uncharacterized protein n=1 Tax=Oryza meyeriana var. granulata TaxID=110450 RepID=A0A1V1H1C1_9ORYZ|nr:hypothetical protein [Oryza meyeriana var. granulata]